MTVEQAMQAVQLITAAAEFGVRSWSVIKAMLADAGHDDDAIEALRPKWDALVDDVRRAAGL